MSSDGPQFSFVVPTFGRRNFLSQALESIRRQTFGDWECIVVDDASPEPVEAPKDDRFQVVHRSENGGPAAARNTGIERATGEVIVFLDDDDLITPERLEIAQEGLQTVPVALCWGGVVGDTGGKRTQMWSGDLGDSILSTMTPHLGQTAIRREVAPRFDERYLGAQDVEWWLRVAMQYPVATVSRVGWLWRRHASARGLNTRRARIDGRLLLMTDHADYFSQHRVAEAFQLRRLGLQYASIGDRRRAVRAFARSLTRRPSLKTLRSLTTLL